jgi:alpha-beta hydrolase superfamily lysophospholipase
MALIGFVWFVNSQPDLAIWHKVHLDEEFTADSKFQTFAEYLELEERLFAQLDEDVYLRVPKAERTSIKRYHRGSQADPATWETNWNRSYERPGAGPGVLLLHGLSDSPYSLRAIGERLSNEGAHVLGLRIPGHGTAPSGLVHATWQDMHAAVVLAMRHLQAQVGERPLYIVGYSNGAALAVKYALNALEDETLPKADRLVLISPEIGVSKMAAFARWQGRMGRVLGLEKLDWNSVSLEYDPYKYNSFSVYAGDQAYRLTTAIQAQLTRLGSGDTLTAFPPTLAFQSVVDSTVSTPALISNLFLRLPDNGHELVLFDINREATLHPLFDHAPRELVANLLRESERVFRLTVLTNADEHSANLMELRLAPGEETPATTPLDTAWPEGLYSLSHVALPFPPDDPVYGVAPPPGYTGIRLGDVTLRGERGALRVNAAAFIRLRWNPFYAYLEDRSVAVIGGN